MHVNGIGQFRLARTDGGGRELEGGTVRLSAWDALQNPSREIKVAGPTGVFYKERFALWPDDEDLVLYREDAGRQISDLSRFTAEDGCIYSLVVRRDVQIFSNTGQVDCVDQSDQWALYRFPQGLPAGFAARLDGAPFWSPGSAPIKNKELPGTGLFVRELTVTCLDLSVKAPPGWTVERFRFSGRAFDGYHAVMEISPAIDYAKKTARILVTRQEERRAIEIKAERVGQKCNGAAYQNTDGRWSILQSNAALDAGRIEGRTLAVHWDQQSNEDPWLTLGTLPLVSHPHFSRRQRLIAVGEPLQVRFGMMNEDHPNRIQLASAVYSTGILEEVRETVDLFLLILREKIEAAPDLRVWVWEEGSPTPRLISKEEVEAHSDNQTLSVLQLSAPNPIGWAVSLDGNWRGARFHVEPRSKNWPRLCRQWDEIFNRGENWGACAAALRWWRFPVLMDPFLTSVQEQVARNQLQTLCAWIAPDALSEMVLALSEAEYYVNSLRTLLWDYRPSTEECKQLWALHEASVFSAFHEGQLSASTTLLLSSHPVLFARIICEVVWTRQHDEEAQVPIVLDHSLFRTAPNPAMIQGIEERYRRIFGIAREFVERQAGYGDSAREANRFEVLRTEALSELRSWTDSRPLDDAYFLEYVIKSAEALFDGRECNTTRLKVAVTRSRACCAFIVSYLLKTRGITHQ
jgi:hypothetical protein